MNSSLKESRNVEEVFECFKKENAEIIKDNSLYQNFYSFIKTIYSQTSGYVHGSRAVSFTLKESVEHIKEEDDSSSTDLIRDFKNISDLIKKFYFIKDENLQELKHHYRFKIPAIKYLMSNKEKSLYF